MIFSLYLYVSSWNAYLADLSHFKKQETPHTIFQFARSIFALHKWKSIKFFIVINIFLFVSLLLNWLTVVKSSQA